MGPDLARRPTTLALLCLVAGCVGHAYAQSDPIADRQEAMGELSQAHKAASAMVKGRVAYDPGAASAAMTAIATEAPKLSGMFPPDSQTGEDTRAAPAIWQRFDDFKAHIATLEAAAVAAAAAAPQGRAGFTPAYAAVAAACKACHEAYRLPEPGGSDPLATP